jgi:hypothetical protein
MPWLGKPFVGIDNYVEAFGDPRFWAALGHTAFFAVTSVGLELIIGLWLALALNRAFRGRGLVRAAVLVPWAIPTVVSALRAQPRRPVSLRRENQTAASSVSPNTSITKPHHRLMLTDSDRA